MIAIDLPLYQEGDILVLQLLWEINDTITGLNIPGWNLISSCLFDHDRQLSLWWRRVGHAEKIMRPVLPKPLMCVVSIICTDSFQSPSNLAGGFNVIPSTDSVC